MTFTERINLDIKNAMLAREKEKLAALRDIKSKLLLEATSGSDTEVSEETAIKICMKLHKQRMEMCRGCTLMGKRKSRCLMIHPA